MSDQQNATPKPAGPAARHSQARYQADDLNHQERVVGAEIRRLQRELRAIGPMPREKLAELCHADRWREGSLDQAVRAGVKAGRLRELPLGWVAAADSPPDEVG